MNEEDIFHQALARSRPEERAAYLEQACAGDPVLRASVEALLRANVGASGFLDQPAAHLVPTVAELSVAEGPGAVIGPYQLLEQIGEGGFGVVFLAEQTEPVRRRVALKVLKPGMDTRQVVARFEAERQALALMDHPNIAQVHDGGTTPDGRPFFVMELVKGMAITDYCDQCSLPTRERLELFLSVCHAVQHAHQKGVIHRDLKPSNVLVAIQDGRPMVKVIDFGVAKAINQRLSEQTLMTGFHQLIGTPLYMSPEQAEMSPLGVDTRADIFSLGVLLYELLTGTTPFEKERLSKASYDELRRIIREEEPPRPSARLSTLKDRLTTVAVQRRTEPRQLLRTVRGELDWIAMKCLEKDRNRRYETANGLTRDLERYLADEPVLACPPGAGYRLRKFVRRHRGPVGAAAVVLGALLVGILGTSWQAIRATQAERLAQQRLEAEKAARAEAMANFRKARQAVDDYFTLVSESTLLQEPTLEPLRKQLLQNALRYYQQFVAARADAPDLQAELAAAYFRIAVLTYEIGAEEDWLPPLQKGFSVLEDLLRRKPDVSTLGSLTGICFFNAVRHFYARDQQEALRTFQHGRAICAELVRQYPTVLGFQNLLAICHLMVGIVDLWTRGPAESADSLQKAVEIWRQLSSGNPSNACYRAVLPVSLRPLSIQLARLGELSRADQTMQRAVVLAQQLVDEFPEVPGYQEVLVFAWEGVGMLREHEGRLEEGIKAYRQTLALQQALHQQHPTVPRLRYSEFVGHQCLGSLLWSTGRLAEAAEEFRRARALWDQLSPQDQEATASYLVTCPDPRFRDPRRAVEVSRQWVERQPRNSAAWNALGFGHYGAGDYPAAQKALENAIALPNDYASWAWFYLAMTHWQLGAKEKAHQCYDQAVKCMEGEIGSEDTRRMRAETEKLLGLKKGPGVGGQDSGTTASGESPR